MPRQIMVASCLSVCYVMLCVHDRCAPVTRSSGKEDQNIDGILTLLPGNSLYATCTQVHKVRHMGADLPPGTLHGIIVDTIGPGTKLNGWDFQRDFQRFSQVLPHIFYGDETNSQILRLQVNEVKFKNS